MNEPPINLPPSPEDPDEVDDYLVRVRELIREDVQEQGCTCEVDVNVELMPHGDAGKYALCVGVWHESACRLMLEQSGKMGMN